MYFYINFNTGVGDLEFYNRNEKLCKYKVAEFLRLIADEIEKSEGK